MSKKEQQEPHRRIEAKSKQEQEKKIKPKKKSKVEQVQVEDIQPERPPETPTMPRGNRGNRNDDGSDDEDHHPQRNHYCSLRDIPKFEGKGEQLFSHLMEFEDYLVASGIRIEPDEENPMLQPDYRDILNKFKASLKSNPRVWYSMYIEKRVPHLHTADGWKTVKSIRIEPDEENPMLQPDYRDILNKFKASLKSNPRVWYSMYIEKRVPHLHTADGWKTVKSKFLTYFNPIGSTKEQQIKAWKDLKWKPEEEKLTDFVFRFSQLAHELGYSDEQQISHFVLYIPRGLYLYLEGAQTVPDVVENLRKGIDLGGLDTFSSITKTVQDDSKPTGPFMMMKEEKAQLTKEDTLRAVKESIHDSMYESSKTEKSGCLPVKGIKIYPWKEGLCCTLMGATSCRLL